ncbi:hypothetical protein [Saccharothrix xinjiangensis]|uniref:Uncharacterized protein n=1 Tax=Saccharothrix xinjiangensis TaxID=204798 RepID=A0ABV9XW54_9PSEU
MEFREDPRWREQLAARKRDLLETDIGPPVLADMQAATPVDTGALRNSLGFDVLSEDLLRFAARQRYAAPVHDGHEIVYRDADGTLVRTGRRVPGQPYMTSALYRHRGGAT